jgi:diguanylate cyclase (GGDEF)-like protein
MLEYPINVLVVAAEEQITREVENLLQEVHGHGFYLQRVVGMEAGLEALREGGCDLCLLDITPRAADVQVGNGDPRLPGRELLVNRFIHATESSEHPVPLLVLADERVLECDPKRQVEFRRMQPTVRLDRSRTNPYLLERAMCFSLERAHLMDEIRRLRTRDPLTGLLSPQAINAVLAQELERCHRYRYTTSLLVLRVNNFTSILDEFGQQLGDQILRWLGMIINENIRTVDYAASYPDGEFLVLLPETADRAAVNVAQRLQLRIASRPFVLFPSDGPVIELEVTVATGIAEAPKDSETGERLVALAERAQQEARRKQNPVVIYADVAAR